MIIYTHGAILNFHATVGKVDRLNKPKINTCKEFPYLDLRNTRHSVDGISLNLTHSLASLMKYEIIRLRRTYKGFEA